MSWNVQGAVPPNGNLDRIRKQIEFIDLTAGLPDVLLLNEGTTSIAPISGGHPNYPFHVTLPGSMDAPSTDSPVQLDQIRTVAIEERIVDTCGTVSPSQMEAIEDAVGISLGLYALDWIPLGSPRRQR